MITPTSAHTARLARIEAALVESIGLFRCLDMEDVPQAWKSQVAEKREMLHLAAIDVMQMRHEEKELLAR